MVQETGVELAVDQSSSGDTIGFYALTRSRECDMTLFFIALITISTSSKIGAIEYSEYWKGLFSSSIPSTIHSSRARLD